jgi:uncharacterized membrane protein
MVGRHISADSECGARARDQRVEADSWSVASISHLLVACSLFSYGVSLLVHRPPLARMLAGELLPTRERSALFATTGALAVVTTVLAVTAFVVLRRVAAKRCGAATPDAYVRALWPIGLLPVLVYCLDIDVWAQAPLTLFVVAGLGLGYAAFYAKAPPGMARLTRRLPSHPVIPWVLLAAMILGYAAYASYHTVVNHYSLGTAAYDLGIHENVLWNSAHGRLFESAIEAEGNHLGVHTTLILLLLLPLYVLHQTPETLLVMQSLALAAAAWPLYVLAHQRLENKAQALLVAGIYLSHPAVGGANFYDFHALAFAPVLFFTAVLLLRSPRRWAFWLAIALLLAVREDMSILVLLLGVVIVVEGDRRRGAAVMALGAAAYAGLQHWVIPHFAGGSHSYAWYYTGLIPNGEGPLGLIRTLVINPVFSISSTLTPDKLLFVFQVFAPLAFASLLSWRGATMISYGLAVTLLASRAPLHQLGFQYVLVVLPPAFLGLLAWLEPRSADHRRRLLALAAGLAMLTCYHYGMFYPRHDFRGGFHRIDFEYSAGDRERYAEVREMVTLIPPDASVTAAEALVPHVARRRKLGTLRYAANTPASAYDYFFVLKDTEVEHIRRMPEVFHLQRYEIVKRGTYCALLRRKSR